jgi:hypothetical protein
MESPARPGSEDAMTSPKAKLNTKDWCALMLALMVVLTGCGTPHPRTVFAGDGLTFDMQKYWVSTALLARFQTDVLAQRASIG